MDGYDGYQHFYNGGGGRGCVRRDAVGGGECFFDRVTILFHKCNNKTLHISTSILVYADVLHIVNIVILHCVFPSP